MLLEFRVENFRSLRDEQAITFEAGRVGDQNDERPRSVPGHNERLLPAAVIYGPNASGKSNVLAAVAFMREAVTQSHRLWEPESGVPRTAFAWGGKQSEPSTFEASFLVDESKYEYGFSVGDDDIQEEWLFAWPNNRKQMWFERESDTFKFGEHLSGPNEAIREVTRTNALFLSAAVQLRHPQLTSLYSWFRGIATVNIRGRFRWPTLSAGLAGLVEMFSSSGGEESSLFSVNDSEGTLAARIRQLLKAADIGIVDVKRIDTEQQFQGRTNRRPRILLQHQFGVEDSWLDFEEESEGTKTLFRMAPSVFRTLDAGGLLLVDELEASLHPLLGLAIVNLFNCPRSNPKNAQIVFTTHDTNLLGTTLGEAPLRRDQIWFTEKDQEGATTLYPLTDYKPRKAENLERGYLQGRYGAIPFLGDLEWITE